VTLHGRKVLTTLLVAVATMALGAPPALANHSTKDLLSIGPTGGNGPEDVFFDFASADGSKVFFETAESLVPADTDSAFDIYQREGATTTLISIGSTGGNGNFDVFPDDVSADGSRVFFDTDEQLVAQDTDSAFDIYERSGGTTKLVSIGPGGGNGPDEAFFHDISRDGTRVFFESEESLVAADTDAQADVYERSGGTTTLVSAGTPGNGNFPAVFAGISEDGTRVFFETEEQLLATDTDATFDVYRRFNGATALMSTGATGGNGPFDATYRGISLDGTRLFFQTDESLNASDTDTSTDVYERAPGTGGAAAVVSAPGNGAFPATFVGNSGDGLHVFFETREALAGGDSDTFVDVYERFGNNTRLVSAGTPGNAAFDANYVGNSVDGARVFFETRESLEAGDTDTALDVYERTNATTTARVSVGGNGPIAASFAGASRDGSRVLVETSESLVASDTDSVNDVYERHAGATTHISIGPSGGNAAIAAFFSGLSEDGERIFFDTRESLMTSDTDTARDVYAADLAGYVRPTGARAIRIPLVPAYGPCTSPNRMHGSPLSYGSCEPPDLESGQLTMGSSDVNGLAPNARGFAKYKAVGAPGGVDDSDVSFAFNFTDVRRQGTLADYTGQLQATTVVRITDRVNGPSGTESATVSDTTLAVTVPCTATGNTNIGATCAVTTSFDAITPGAVPEGKRSVWQLDRVRVNDGGPDGLASTTPNTLFLTQGVFVP
jgi:hypothetical protein